MDNLAIIERLDQLEKKIDGTFPVWQNIKQACNYCGVSRKTLYNAVQRGVLKRGVVRAKGERIIRFKTKDLDNFMNG
tara:strand:- start:134 stop:364 length:231 start_codon:yes stop_codon:yes gene_type:complete